jgi:hypothetical protein
LPELGKLHGSKGRLELFIADRALKYEAMERLVRLAFFEFLRRDPWFVFETFVIVKGKWIWNTLVDATVTEWNRAGWKARLLFFLIIASIGGMAAQRLAELQRLSRLATVVTAGAVSSLSIPFLTLVTAQTMTEEIMALQMAAVLLLSLAAAHLIRVCRQGQHRRPAVFTR